MTQTNRSPQLSCLPVSLFSPIIDGQMDCAQWAEAAMQMGFDGYDVSTLFFRSRTPSYLQECKRKLRDIPLPMVMMTSYPDFLNPDPVQAERERYYFQSDIALASELGCRYVRVTPGPRHKEISTGEGIRRIAEIFGDMADFSARFNVLLVYENHAKPGAWNDFDFSYDSAVFLAICRRLRGSGVRVNFDFGNPVAFGQSPGALLAQVMDLVETVHISDMSSFGVFSPCAIGKGVVPIFALLRQLKDAGFCGWFSIEEASGGGLDGIREAKRTVDSLFLSLSYNNDPISEDSTGETRYD